MLPQSLNNGPPAEIIKIKKVGNLVKKKKKKLVIIIIL